MSEREDRLKNANELLRVIAATGRHFFRYDDRCAEFVLRSDRVWFIDHYTGKAVYCHQRWFRKGFTGGGTLNSLVRALAQYIFHGTMLPAGHLGPWKTITGAPYCRWAYNDDMDIVRETAWSLGIAIEPKSEAVNPS